MSNSESAVASQRLSVAVYTPPARLAAALLIALSRGSLLAILVLLALSEGPVNPLRLIRLVAAFCLLPGLAALILRWLLRGSLCVDADHVVLEQGGRRVEVPIASIAAVEPWSLPLPQSGVALRLRSGKRWRDGIALADPALLVEALAAAGAVPRFAELTGHASFVYARARARTARRWWLRALLDFPVFALVPTIPLFRVHQIIAYGGAFGEYYQYGFAAYLAGFLIYWAVLTIYLMLYAAALRVPVEVAAAACALWLPRQAVRVRRLLEHTTAVLYYVGVPTAVVLRFLA